MARLRALKGLAIAGLFAIGAGQPLSLARAAESPGGGEGDISVAVTGIDPEQISCFLGGVDSGEFVPAEMLAEKFRRPTSYRLFSLAGPQGEATAPGAPLDEGSEGECADLWRHEIALDPRQKTDFVAALHAPSVAEPMPKVLELLATPRPEHEKLVRDFLMRRDVSDPVVELRQIIRTDLDGDGIDDWVLNAVRNHSEQARKGDYSVVLVVKGTASASRTFIIQDEITLEDSPYPSTLWVNSIVAILDTDGDGVMEIVMNGAYLYGGGWELIRFEEGGYEHILFCGCDG